MKKISPLIFWCIPIVVSVYVLFEIYSFPTSVQGFSLFGFSLRRIMLFIIPTLSILFSIIMIGVLIGFENHYNKFVALFEKIPENKINILQGISFWLAFTFGSFLIWYQFYISPSRDSINSLLGMSIQTFCSYVDRLLGVILLLIVWAIIFFALLLLYGNTKFTVRSCIFFNSSDRTLLALGSVVFVSINIYNLYWLRNLTGHSFGSDFMIYFHALLKASDGLNPYVPYEIGTGFINHPFLLSFISFITNRERDFNNTYIIWSLLNITAWAITLKICLENIENLKIKWFLFALLLTSYGPFYEVFYIGQVNAFVILAISLFFKYRKNEWAMGLFLAISIVLKTSPIIFFAYLFVTRRWKAIISSVISLAILSIIPAIQFSINILPQFFTAISKVGFEIHTQFYNESLVSLLYQFLVHFYPDGTAASITRIITLASMTAILATICVIHLFTRNKDSENLLFICFILIMVAFSPLVWYHHFVFVIIPLLGLYHYPISMDEAGIFPLSMIFLIQLQRIVEIFAKPGFPTLLVLMILMVYYLSQYISRNKKAFYTFMMAKDFRLKKLLWE